MNPNMKTVVCLALLVFWFPRSSSGFEKYSTGNYVTLWSDKAGPRKNPQVWFPYDHLPICTPNMGIAMKNKHEGLGAQLSGYHLFNSGLDIRFDESMSKRSICKQTIDDTILKFYQTAARNEFRFNMYIDDLPIWGEMAFLKKPVEGGEEDVYVYVHKKLTIHHNGPYIIKLDLKMENEEKLELEKEIEYTYEVAWHVTETTVANRFDPYLDRAFFESLVHLFSAFNSFMIVAFLCVVVALILIKTLRKDFAKYTKNDEDLELVGQMIIDDSGWKQVHGDAFRAPRHLTLYAALYGSGCHLIALTVMTLLFCLLGFVHGDVYKEPGELSGAIIMCYAISSPVAGYASGHYYRQFFMTPRAEQSSNWQRCMILTAVLVPALVFGFTIPPNILIYSFHAVPIPFVALFELCALWIFVVFPLIVIGSMVGRHFKGREPFPCRIHSIPRQIPISPWYTSPPLLVLAAGILPFASIFIELYFTYSSVWRYKVYYMYGMGMLVFIFLVIVVVCTAIVAVYLVLNAENHHWQWVGFLSGGSTSLYVFLYSCYFFAFDTEMYGFLQSFTFFSQMILFSILLSILCGTIGVIGSTLFVKKILSSIKVD